MIKDPLTLKYFRFEDEEYSLLKWLDGRRSLEAIKEQFESTFPPQKITLQEMHQFFGAMHRQSLVVSDASGQGRTLERRQQENRRRERMAALSNVLCIRFKGIDPDALLTWLNPKVGWLFSTTAALVVFILAAAALALVIVNIDVFQSRLPDFHNFFAARNWLWLAATLAVTKVIHEFGHGLACKRFGGECHEMGVMLLVLTPCLYCNVSDSWMLSDKWRRAAIAAAGMYLEIALASVCTFIWWNTKPGLLNYLCLNVMFISSVSTLLFNANPLLRYDGYYILADLLEIPNLRQKSTAIVQRKAGAWFLGLPETSDPFLPVRRRSLFAAYSVAAFAYRWIVVFSILWFLLRILEPYGLQAVGYALVGVSLYGLTLHPLYRLARFLSVPGRMNQVSLLRSLSSAAVIGGIIAAVLLIPTPHDVRCHLHLRPRDAAPVYVEVGGRVVTAHALPGRKVRAGDPILTLRNPDVEFRIQELEGRREQLKSRAEGANSLALLGVEASALELDELLESIRGVERQLRELRDDEARLVVRAAREGEVIAAPYKPRGESDVELATWSGRPTSPQTVGAHLPYGQLVCHVGDPGSLQAILLVHQDDIEFVDQGQSVRLVLDQQPGQRFDSRLQHVAKRPTRKLPKQMAGRNGGPIASRASGRDEIPLDTFYEAAADLDPDMRLTLGGLGQARIRVGWRTIGERLVRYVRQLTF